MTRCMKVGFSKHAAQVALVACVIGKNRGRGKRRESRIYECPACGQWHLTSKPVWKENA